MTRTFIVAAVAALALTAGAADARMHHHKSAAGHKATGSVATRDLNNKQLASMDSAGAGMSMAPASANGSAAGGMATTPPAPASPAAPMGSMDPQQPK